MRGDSRPIVRWRWPASTAATRAGSRVRWTKRSCVPAEAPTATARSTRSRSTSSAAAYGVVLIAKGAPEQMLARCVASEVDGVEQPLDAAGADGCRKTYDELSA